MKFAIIGKGFGRHYSRLLESLGCEYTVVTKGNVEKAFGSDIDCVIIASPPETHYEYIVKALMEGKHVLVEKPMVLSSEDAEKIKPLIGDKVFMVAHQYCYNDEVRKQKPREMIKLEHSFQGKNAFREVAPHLFSVVDLLDFKGEVELIILYTPEKIRKWTFDGIELKQPTTEPLRNEIVHFVDCVTYNKTPLTDIEHGIRVLRNMEKYEAQHRV